MYEDMFSKMFSQHCVAINTCTRFYFCTVDGFEQWIFIVRTCTDIQENIHFKPMFIF